MKMTLMSFVLFSCIFTVSAQAYEFKARAKKNSSISEKDFRSIKLLGIKQKNSNELSTLPNTALKILKINETDYLFSIDESAVSGFYSVMFAGEICQKTITIEELKKMSSKNSWNSSPVIFETGCYDKHIDDWPASDHYCSSYSTTPRQARDDVIDYYGMTNCDGTRAPLNEVARYCISEGLYSWQTDDIDLNCHHAPQYGYICCVNVVNNPKNDPPLWSGRVTCVCDPVTEI